MAQRGRRAGNFLPRRDGLPGSGAVDPRVVALTAPASGEAEQYRALHQRLERARGAGPLGAVSLVAATPGEGTTLTAANLAVTAARAHRERRVILVELNLQAPGLAAALGVPPAPGVIEVLAGEAGIADAARRFHGTPLTVMCAGRSAEALPADWMCAPELETLLEGLRANFDEVLVDLPPVLACADGVRVAARTAGVLLVIRARHATGRDVGRALELMEGLPMLGCVLNDADRSNGWGR
jgi:Mrp family chromosome partitioning ATPase